MAVNELTAADREIERDQRKTKHDFQQWVQQARQLVGRHTLYNDGKPLSGMTTGSLILTTSPTQILPRDRLPFRLKTIRQSSISLPSQTLISSAFWTSIWWLHRWNVYEIHCKQALSIKKLFKQKPSCWTSSLKRRSSSQTWNRYRRFVLLQTSRSLPTAWLREEREPNKTRLFPTVFSCVGICGNWTIWKTRRCSTEDIFLIYWLNNSCRS